MIGKLWPDSNCWCWGASCLSHAIWMRWSFTRPRASQKASAGFRSTPSQVCFPFSIWDVILPIDELIFFRGVAQPPGRGWRWSARVDVTAGARKKHGCWIGLALVKHWLGLMIWNLLSVCIFMHDGPDGLAPLRFLILKIQLFLIKGFSMHGGWTAFWLPSISVLIQFLGGSCGRVHCSRDTDVGQNRMGPEKWRLEIDFTKFRTTGIYPLMFHVRCEEHWHTYWCLAGNLREWSTGQLSISSSQQPHSQPIHSLRKTHQHIIYWDPSSLIILAHLDTLQTSAQHGKLREMDLSPSHLSGFLILTHTHKKPWCWYMQANINGVYSWDPCYHLAPWILWPYGPCLDLPLLLESYFDAWHFCVARASSGEGWRLGCHCAVLDLWTVFVHVSQNLLYTSSTAQGGGGSFKNRKPIGEVGCCESGMAERIHWWTERCLISLTLSLSFSAYLPTYLSIFYVSIQLSIYLSFSLFHLSICLSVYLSIYGAVSSSLMQCSVL